MEWSPAWACGLRPSWKAQKQMPGLLEPLLSGPAQRRASATQGFELEPVHKAAVCVHSTQELATLGL